MIKKINKNGWQTFTLFLMKNKKIRACTRKLETRVSSLFKWYLFHTFLQHLQGWYQNFFFVFQFFFYLVIIIIGTKNLLNNYSLVVFKHVLNSNTLKFISIHLPSFLFNFFKSAKSLMLQWKKVLKLKISLLIPHTIRTIKSYIYSSKMWKFA